MSIFPPPSTRTPAPDRIRVEVYDRVLRIVAGRNAEREMREMLEARGLNTSELRLFVEATAD